MVTLPAELTFTRAEQVRCALAAAFGPGLSTVAADCGPTVFCDSARMRELVRRHKHATAADAVFRVVGIRCEGRRATVALMVTWLRAAVMSGGRYRQGGVQAGRRRASVMAEKGRAGNA